MTPPENLTLVTDAWAPQVNGVVRTWEMMRAELPALNTAFHVIAPDQFRTIPCPTYPEIRLALWPWSAVARALDSARPAAVHIATEGPLGLAARRHCLKRGWPFTTSYHTKFPEYVQARFRVPVSWGYAAQRRFHRPAAAVMVATETVKAELAARGFQNLRSWTRGVDTKLFRPQSRAALRLSDGLDLAALPRPVFACVGRVAVEKNIEAFLSADLEGTKLIVGDGPAAADLRQRFPQAVWVGMRHGEDLAACYAAADVLAMPSLTETFGVVQLEALACGTPVAAFPAPGPRDLLSKGDVGVMDADFAAACRAALAIPRDRCRAFAETYSWARCAEMLQAALAPIAR